MAQVGLSLMVNRRITGVKVSRWLGEGRQLSGERESETLPGRKGRTGDDMAARETGGGDEGDNEKVKLRTWRCRGTDDT